MIVRFSEIAAGGDGVGRDENGRVVFAPYAAPGEVAEVEITEEIKSFARGRILNILEPAPERIEPPCPYFLPVTNDPATACGGCQIQHLSTSAQLDAKRRIVLDALHRVGGFSVDELNGLVRETQTAQTWNYRNKADFVVSVEDNAHQSTLTPLRIGFNARHSHDVIDIHECPIQQDGNNKVLLATRAAMEKGLAKPFDIKTGRGVLRRLVSRVASNGETLAVAVTTREKWPQDKEFARWMMAQLPELKGVLRREPRGVAKVLLGRDWLEDEVLGLRLRVTGEGFFQINTSLIANLVETAMQALDPQSGERILDLFCGVGLFALFAARSGAEVLGIETNPQAIRDARGNAKHNGFGIDFKVGEAARELAKLQAGAWDKVLLDPPRDGARECLSELLRLQPKRIVYVSCDAATLARDLKVLSEQYQLMRATPLDMFPQTAHVETVAMLERRDVLAAR